MYSFFVVNAHLKSSNTTFQVKRQLSLRQSCIVCDIFQSLVSRFCAEDVSTSS